MIKGLNLTAKFICGYKMALAILIHYNRNVHRFYEWNARDCECVQHI